MTPNWVAEGDVIAPPITGVCDFRSRIELLSNKYSKCVISVALLFGICVVHNTLRNCTILKVQWCECLVA
jgi:hypothetical protein